MKTVILAAVLGYAALVAADATPLTPPQTNEGSPLAITWTPDPTGTWKSCTISLMSGSNFNMQKVVDITTTQDCTTTPGSLSWTVPAVTPTSLIYFLQFTNNADATAPPSWTTRFGIANNGVLTPPENQVQEDGKQIPWGVGELASGGGGAANSSASSSSVGLSSTSSSLPVTSSTTSSTPSSMVVVSSTPAASVTTSRPASSSRAVNAVSATSSKVTGGAMRTGASAGAAAVVALVGYAVLA